jgi:hypothetical protein
VLKKNALKLLHESLGNRCRKSMEILVEDMATGTEFIDADD